MRRDLERLGFELGSESELLLMLMVCTAVGLTVGLLAGFLTTVAAGLAAIALGIEPVGLPLSQHASHLVDLAVFFAVSAVVAHLARANALARVRQEQIRRQTDELAERAAEALRLAEVDRSRSALMAAVGHEFRNSLSVIRSTSEALTSYDSLAEGDRRTLSANILSGVSELEHLVNNLLDSTRIEAGSMGVHLRPTDLLDALESPLRVGRPVQVDVPDDLPLVTADVGLLERVLANLLHNAMKFAPEGDLEVRACEEAHKVKVAVVDHGTQLAPSDYVDLFNPRRPWSDHRVGGLGMGLSVARALTESMRGRLDPSPTPGGGLTMTITLNVAPCPD